MVRREKRDVLKELPPLTRQVMWIDGCKEASVAYQKAALNLEPGAAYTAMEATLAGKMETAFELARDLKRFLIFTWRRADARQMAKVLTEKWGTPASAVTGDMDTMARQRTVRLAAEKGIGIVATIDSVGTGMDALKHVASTGIFHSLDWVPQKMAQAEARLHRIGQLENVHWIYLAMKDSYDVPVVKTVVGKLDQWAAIMGRGDSKGMRDVLDDSVAAGNAEKEALRALYEEMK